MREHLDRTTASGFLARWTEQNISPEDREGFRDMAETELLGLPEGNFARYQIRPAEFAAWQAIWATKTLLKMASSHAHWIAKAKPFPLTNVAGRREKPLDSPGTRPSDSPRSGRTLIVRRPPRER